jgi:hypothetical protein
LVKAAPEGGPSAKVSAGSEANPINLGIVLIDKFFGLMDSFGKNFYSEKTKTPWFLEKSKSHQGV